jgi:hypothetical protein
MKKALIIGAGGIEGKEKVRVSSYFSDALFDLIMKNQIDLENYDFYVADNDSVEQKNILYQNFTTKDLFRNKAEVIGERYKFISLQKKIIAKDLLDYDFVIVCADNGRIRKDVFECRKSGLQFIDLRSEGRTIAFFTSSMPQNELLETLDSKSLDNSGSCQLKHEFEKGIIQQGNKIIALIGSQLFLNYVRQSEMLPSFIQRF